MLGIAEPLMSALQIPKGQIVCSHFNFNHTVCEAGQMTRIKLNRPLLLSMLRPHFLAHLDCRRTLRELAGEGHLHCAASWHKPGVAHHIAGDAHGIMQIPLHL